MPHKRKRCSASFSGTDDEEGRLAKAQKLALEHKNRDSVESLLPDPPSSNTSVTAQPHGASNTSLSPPSSASSPPILFRLPLTKGNLRKLDNTNMPSTPSNKKRSRPASGTGTSTSTTQSVNSVRRVLEYNHIYIGDLEAEERGESVIENAKRIVKGDRQSVLKEDRAQELRRTAMKHASDNELTFLVNVWKKFLDVEEDARSVRVTADGDLEDPEAAIQWIETAWTKEGIKCNWSADFTRGSVPELFIKDEALKKIVEDAPLVKNPRPDLTYGLSRTTFSPRKQKVNDSNGACLSQDLYHPFFVVEAKSCNKPIIEAAQQCARAGAAMVRLKRDFEVLARGTYNRVPGTAAEQEEGEQHFEYPVTTTSRSKPIPIDHYRADEGSFAFSLALIPSAARLYVNWAEEALSTEDRVITINWHQHIIAHYCLEMSKDWIELHHDLDNVLDWGLIEHKSQCQMLCSIINDNTEDNGDLTDSRNRRKIGV